MFDKRSSVYIMSSKSGVLYIGITSDLVNRVNEHKLGIRKGFSEKYKTKKLVYYEQFGEIRLAIVREKQLKGWSRNKKLSLIKSINPELKDLSLEWE